MREAVVVWLYLPAFPAFDSIVQTISTIKISLQPDRQYL